MVDEKILGLSGSHQDNDGLYIEHVCLGTNISCQEMQTETIKLSNLCHAVHPSKPTPRLSVYHIPDSIRNDDLKQDRDDAVVFHSYQGTYPWSTLLYLIAVLAFMPMRRTRSFLLQRN